MNNKAFMDAFMSKIIDEVIKRIQNKPKKALVLFSGAAIGFNEAMDSLVKLKDDGWQLKVFLSDEAMTVLTPSYIKETLNVDVIYNSKSQIAQKDLYGDVDKIIIASTTVNTAAKLAHGICDNAMLTIINHGLMAGTDCVCAVDGACPDNETRKKIGMGNSSDGYREILRNNLRIIQSFGIKTVNAEDLYAGCINSETTAVGASCVNKVVTVKEADPFDTDDGMIAKRIISRGDVLAHRNSKVIKIPADAIITEYAKEAIATLGLQVEKI
ncbi:MAG: flavoprotein [Eubacterium sp.]